MTQSTTSLWKNAQMVGTYALARLASDPTTRVRRLYDMYPSTYLFADRSTYINYGYWQDGCDSLDEASAALADLLAHTAGIGPGASVLDVGFGYGDQDFAWLREYGPAKIHGLNIATRQVEAARARAEREGVADRLTFEVGSATDMPVSAGRFNRVVALECAHHFFPRRAFLAEAFRLLKPGGVLAATDVVPRSAGISQADFHAVPLTWVSITVDQANWYPRETYERELAEVGFTDIRLESIRDRVLEPWRQHIVRKLDDPVFQRRVGRMYHRMLTRMWSDQPLLQRELGQLDYLLVHARKPDDTA